MSVGAVAWALQWAPVENAQEHVLLIALADRADEYGRAAWPYQEDLAARGRCSIRTVRRHLTAMEKRGLIVRGDQRLVAHFRPDQRPIVWDLDMSQRVPDAPVDHAAAGASNRRPDKMTGRSEGPGSDSGERPDKLTGRTNGASDTPNDRPDNMTGRTELCPSDRTELCPPIRPVRPSSSGYVEGGTYVTNARELIDPPQKHHPEHPDEWVDDCDECDALAEAWVARTRVDLRTGSGPVSSDVRPADRCARHRNEPRPPNCGGCADARRGAEAWDAEQRQRASREQSERARLAAEDRKRAIAECAMCDEDGYAGTSLCDHDPDTVDRARRHAADIREMLAEKAAQRAAAATPTPEHSDGPAGPSSDQPAHQDHELETTAHA